MYNCDLSKIDVLILVGGKGQRLKKISKDVPKPLVLINNKPFLSILLNYLETFGFKRIVLCTGYKSEYIRRYISQENFSTFQLLISYEKKALGTAGAIKNATKLIESDRFIVINGDTFLELNYFDFNHFFLEKNAVALLALTKNSNTKEYGRVKIDSNNKIIYYREKLGVTGNETDFISAGAYIFNRAILNYIPSKTKVSLEYEIFPFIINMFKGKVYGYYSPALFIDIGTSENFYKAQDILKQYQRGEKWKKDYKQL